ncbi:MAG: glycosyltransferase family 2 protein [Bacteroidales bacterium]|nr:glycosyltransferase family 2 protein [Bacteroidales bacterium]
MSSLISIALATYNGEKFLAEFLDSVYSQSYQNIEVIAVDDCSTDETEEILAKYKNTHGLKYEVNSENLGFIKNFEKVLSLCSGEYIALADQDDIWFPEKVATLLDNIGNHLLIHSDAILIDAKKNKIADSFTRFSNKKVRLTSFKNLLFYNNVTGCTSMIKKELIQKALPFPDKIIYHDWWLALVAAKYGNIQYLQEPFLYYRQHDNVSGGAEIMQLKPLISNSIFKGFLIDRYEKNLKFINWFQSIKTFFNIENANELKLINGMINYHNTFFTQRVRLSAFFIHLRYFKFMYPHYRLHTKILILFTSLIGLGKKLKTNSFKTPRS